MILKSLSSIAAVTLVLCGGTAQAVELVNNGNFSAGLTGWFQDAGGAPGSMISVVDGAAKLVAGTGPSDVIIKASNLGIGTVTPNATVTVSFDAKGSWSAGGVNFAELFSEVAPNGTSKSQLLGGAPLFAQGKGNLADWTSFSYTTTLGPVVTGGISLLLKSSCGADAGCTAVSYFDNVSITAVPEPETYALMLAGLAGLAVMARRRRAG